MSKIKREIVAFSFLLILVVLWALFTQTSVNSSTSVNTSTSAPESQVTGLFIQFKDGTTEPEVKAILQNINMTTNFSLEYNTNITDERYYIMVDKDKIISVRSESRKVKNWTEPTPTIKKGNYYLIIIPEQVISDEDFIAMLNKHDLQLKRFVWCDIHFVLNDGPLRYWIPKKDAIRIKNELEKNENIFTVHLSYIYSS